MAQEGIAWIIGDRHCTSASLTEEIADGAAIGHQRHTTPLSIWHTVGTVAAVLTGTEQIFSRSPET